MIPVHVQGCHWTCACINFTEKRIEYYDSLSDNGFRKNVFRVGQSFSGFRLTAELEDVLGGRVAD